MPEPETPEPAVVVESPQDGAEAGENATSGNAENMNEALADPTGEPDELELPADPPESDGTDADTPALTRARDQAARYRRQLRDTESERDELAAALWHERVTGLGILADPADLPFDADALFSPTGIRELAEALVANRPHLRSRKIRARAGQGEGSTPADVSLAGMLRRNA